MNNKEEKLERLLQKYLAGECTPEEEAFISGWYEKLDSRQPYKLVSSAELKRQQSQNWLALNSRLKKLNQEGKSREVKPRQHFAMWVGVAAVMLIALGIRLYSFVYPAGFSGSQVAQRNNTAGVQRVSLQDGTLVWLEPGASIQYPGKFKAGSRDVYLKGKAFFDVARDPQHPFRVYGASLEVKVLGTSFGVDFNAGKQVAEVLVRTGKVAVTPAEQHLLAFLPVSKLAQETLNLHADEKALFNAQAKTLVKRRIVPGYWERQIQDSDLTFSDTPLAQVIQQLEDQYKVAIGFEDPQLKNCTLTAHFHDQPIAVKLEMICKSIGADFKSVDGKFLIFGEGCNQ